MTVHPPDDRRHDLPTDTPEEASPPPDARPRRALHAARDALTGALRLLEREGLAFLVLGALLLLAGATWYAISRTFDSWARGLTIAGVASVAIYALLRPQDLQRLLTGRTVRYGSNALILSIAAIGIVVLLNVLANRYYVRYDVTADNLHSLSPQSLQVLRDLEGPIDVIGLYPSGQGQESFERWLDEYQAHTDQIRYRSVDPIRQPGEADRLGWDAYGGGLIVQRGARSQQVRTPDEQDITSALLKVSRDTSTAIYFLSGHGEPSPTGYEDTDYGQVGALLEDNNYLVRSLNLAIGDAVPADAGVVVVAGLDTPLLDGERAALRSYLEGGGKALIMLDPGPESGINDVLAPWEVRVENALVVDAQRGLSGDPVTPLIDRYQFSQITKDLPMLALPLACPIAGPAAGTASGFLPLAQTSASAWAEGDPQVEELRYDEGQDLPGPLTLLATVEDPAAETDEVTRMVLVGDADLITNGVLAQIPNGQYLLLNAVNWLAEEESLIAIGPKTNVARSVRMTAIQEGATCFGSLILIPGTIALAGLLVWLKRR
ncbi:MAG: GldG family protein [Anaerolineae bacterium]|nr:GldG family protein [Anaerolineae bacterium]